MKIGGSASEMISSVDPRIISIGAEDLCVVDLEYFRQIGTNRERFIVCGKNLSSSEVIEWTFRHQAHSIIQAPSNIFQDEFFSATILGSTPDEFLKNPMDSLFFNSLKATLTYRVEAASDKKRVLYSIEQGLEKIHGAGAIRASVLKIADELYTNAIHNAPFEKSKIKNEIIPQVGQADLIIGYSDTSLVIGCRDSFGTLDISVLLSGLENCYRQGVSKSIRKTGIGAGIGCFLAYEVAMSLYAVVNPLKATFIGFRLPMALSQAKGQVISKSLHFREVDSQDIQKKGVRSMKNLRIEEKRNDTTSLNIILTGMIDEDAVLTGIEMGGATEVILDLGGVTSLNSCGVREWIRWIQGITTAPKYVFIHCPQVVVDQMNMVDGFLPKNSQVLSFYVPYFCEKCDEVTYLLFQQGQQFDPSGIHAPTEVKCEKCAALKEMDVIPQRYFNFLKSTK